MRFKIVFLLSVLLILGACGSSQTTVKGVVYDIYNRKAVPEAQLLLKELQKIALTDRKGFFQLDSVPPGTYHLLINHLSYAQKVIYPLKVDKKGLDTLTIYIEPLPDMPRDAWQPPRSGEGTKQPRK